MSHMFSILKMLLGNQEQASFSLATTAAVGTLECLIILYTSELVTLRYPSLSASGSRCKSGTLASVWPDVPTPVLTP